MPYNICVFYMPYHIYHIPYTIYHIPYTIYHIPYTIYHLQLTSVTLTPDKTQSGVFIVSLNGEVVWDRKNKDTLGFPEAKALKQRVRDRVAPRRDLGHSEAKA
jgi:selT/selW/selH-like putative selenoprotein